MLRKSADPDHNKYKVPPTWNVKTTSNVWSSWWYDWSRGYLVAYLHIISVFTQLFEGPTH